MSEVVEESVTGGEAGAERAICEDVVGASSRDRNANVERREPNFRRSEDMNILG